MKQILMNNRIKVLLLAFVLLFAGMCFCVGGTYAHYENQVSQQTVYGNEKDVFTWGFLENTTQVAPSTLNTTITITEDQIETASITEISNTIKILRYPEEDGVALLQLTYPTGCDTAVLQYQDAGFPAGTVYSLDGKTGSTLSASGGIQLTTTQGGTLLLQVPESGVVDVYYFANDMVQSHDKCYVEIIPSTSIWSVAVQETHPILGAGKSLTWHILGDDGETTYDVKVQYLLEGGYADITADYPLTIAQDTSKKTITVSNTETQNALAGTYRMRITYNYKVSESQTICLQTLEVPFFVNYR